MEEENEKNGKITRNSLEEFKDVLNEGKDIGKEFSKQGRELTETGQDIFDLADSTLNLLGLLDTNTENISTYHLEDYLENWQLLINRAQFERDRISNYDYVIISSSIGTASIASSDLFDDLAEHIPEQYKQKFNFEYRNFQGIISRSANKDKVKSLMKIFHLDISYQGRISALQQFEISYDAMIRPVTDKVEPANTSLIPMREAIETTLDHLLYLRPQRKNIGEVNGQNKDWRKIYAIAEQLRRDDIDIYQAHSWARDWVNLKKNDLSPAKTEPISREEWIKRINKSTIFLISLLNGLDPNKLANLK